MTILALLCLAADEPYLSLRDRDHDATRAECLEWLIVAACSFIAEHCPGALPRILPSCR
jgi:hypothetical protein